MKLLNYSVVALAVTCLSNVVALPLTHNNFDLFLQPLQMTSLGVEGFFSNLYNSKSYTEYFPNSFSHLVQFLEHGKDTGQNRDYTKATVSLFNQKLHGCQYVSAYAFNDFLATLPHLVGHHFTSYTKTADKKKQAVTQILYQEFLQNFNEFKENPPAFFDKLSTALVNTIDPDSSTEVSHEYLQQTVVRFLETALSKILWDTNDRNVWENVKQISDNILQIHQHGIIREEDDLNDLGWALTHRICYFIEIAGSDLPAAFYEQVNRELGQEPPAILALEEQEELAQTKLAVIERAIVEGMAHHQARQHGLITEALPS